MMTINQNQQLLQTRSIKKGGVVHDADFECFRCITKPDPTILDVGANRGQSIASFKLLFPESNIDSFEANPLFFPILEGVKAWYSNVQIHNYGLGSDTGVLEFQVPIVDGKAYLEEGSTRDDNFEKPWVIERLKSYGEKLEFDVFPVEIRVADQALHEQAVDIVKIDVEGAEFDVLSSMTRIIERSRPVFLIENSDFDNVTPFLEGLGYLCYQYFSDCNELRPLEYACTNCIYVHPENDQGLSKIMRDSSIPQGTEIEPDSDSSQD
ncbi:MAG: FkbM family methyltransferase [Halioglobus sp.]